MAPKNPTNADILKEVREIKDAQHDMNSRLTTLEVRAISEDAAKKAISEYKTNEDISKRRKVINDLGPLIFALILLADLIIQHVKK